MLIRIAGLLLFSLLFYAASPAVCQTGSTDARRIDSLLAGLPKLMNSDREEANRQIGVILKLSKQEGYEHGIIEGSFYRAWYIYKYGSPDDCIEAIRSALKLPGIKKDPSEANFYILLGQCYVKKSDFRKAIEYFEISRKISRSKGDRIKETNAMVSVGWAYMESKLPREAIRFFQLVLQDNPGEDYPSRTTLLSNIAACYNMLGEYASAESYAKKAVRLSRERGNLSDLANALNILARSFHERGDTPAAIVHLKEAAQAREKVSDPGMLASDYLELSSVHSKTGRYPEAIMYAKKAEAISYVNRNDLKLAASYEALAKGFEESGDLANSVKYYKKLKTHQDSTGNGRYEESLAELKVKYDIERKEAENLRLQQEVLRGKLELANKQKLNVGLSAVALLALVIAGFIYLFLRNRYRTRTAIQQISEEKRRVESILETEETERRRIAADLHDGVCQMLAAASLQLDLLKREMPENAELRKADEILEQTRREVRSVSHQMTPELLLEHGLANAIRQGVAQLNSAGSGTSFNFFEDLRSEALSGSVSVVLYRAFQELCSNILKHADARTVEISLISDDTDVSLMIEDDGKGFGPSTDPGKLGLLNLRSRVKALNGILNIDSKPGEGTTVVLKFDLSNVDPG